MRWGSPGGPPGVGALLLREFDLIEPTVSTFVDFAYRINAAISIRESETKLNGSVRMVGPGTWPL